MEGMFIMATAAAKSLPLEQFPPDAISCCHETRNIPCFNVLTQKEDNVAQAIDLVIESVALPNHVLHNTELSEVQSKHPIREMSDLHCTVTRSCLAAPFAGSLYV